MNNKQQWRVQKHNTKGQTITSGTINFYECMQGLVQYFLTDDDTVKVIVFEWESYAKEWVIVRELRPVHH